MEDDKDNKPNKQKIITINQKYKIGGKIIIGRGEERGIRGYVEGLEGGCESRGGREGHQEEEKGDSCVFLSVV